MDRILVKTFSLMETNDDWPPQNAKKFIEWLTDKFNKIPEQYKDNANIYFGSETSYDQELATIEMSYFRQETDEEIQKKENQNKIKKEELVMTELEEYRRLTTKYGRLV